MSVFTQFAGGAATTSITNAYSAGGVNSGTSLVGAGLGGGKEILSGALTANTLATPAGCSISGSGEVPWLSAQTKDVTARTIRLKVTVDGVVVFDSTSNSISASGYGVIAVGSLVGTNSDVSGAPIRFNSSLLIQVASSLTETDKVSVGLVMNKR